MGMPFIAGRDIIGERRERNDPRDDVRKQYAAIRQNLHLAIGQAASRATVKTGFEKHCLELAKKAMDEANAHLMDAQHEALESLS